MSIIESLKKLVDPIAAREAEQERKLVRTQPVREASGPPPAFECRVCHYVGPDPVFCPECLAGTMRPTTRQAPPPPEPAPLPAPAELPIDGTLDLHTFAPAEVKDLLEAYLAACAARGLRSVRVVHGKGTGVLRRLVEAQLAKSPLVESHRPADEGAGGWGATLVTLR